MSAAVEGREQAEQPSGRRRLPGGAGPLALLLISAVAVASAIWGVLFADPGISVDRYDAGAVDRFAIREVTAYPELDLYVVGLEDGRLRALDGRVLASGCSVVWRPLDERGRGANPGQAPGVFEDPCSGALWSMHGNAISGSSEPLRTPYLRYEPDAEGELHLVVELINHPAFR